MSTSLKGKVTSVQGETVTVMLENGEELRVPKTACEGEPKQGLEVRLVIAIPGAEDAARQSLSRDLLNELLKKNP